MKRDLRSISVVVVARSSRALVVRCASALIAAGKDSSYLNVDETLTDGY